MQWRYKKAEPQGHNSRGAIGQPGGNEISIEGFTNLSQFEIKRSKKAMPRGHNSRRDIGRSGGYKAIIELLSAGVK